MENSANTSSCLAITEKKTHRPGGCVGIFFQLFDWNRRFTKKKLFSKKFISPARAKQGFNKFKADDKMPSSKLHLISDENHGGFPIIKKGSIRGSVNLAKENEMRAPSLVAKLMGLESMPVVKREKSKKAPFSESCEKGSEKGSVKLQKTDCSEKSMVTRFRAEALPFKNALSRPRKNHNQSKLPSPLKSPRFPSGRSFSRTSRLIDAASRILEPGLQATNRAKGAITYSNSRTRVILPLHGENSANSFVGITSYDIFPGVGQVNRNPNEKPSAYRSLDSNSDDSFSQEPARRKTMLPGLSIKQERDLILERRWEEPRFLDNDRNNINGSFVNEPGVERVYSNCQHRSPLGSSQPRKLQKHDSSNQISPGREEISARSKKINLHSGRVSSSANVPGRAKDSGASNRCIKFANGREDPLPRLRTSTRKRRMIGAGEDLNNAKPRSLDCDKLTERRLGIDPYSIIHSCSKNKSAGQRESRGVYGKNTDQILTAMEEETMDNRRRVSFQKPYEVRGDAIGAFLEQKWKELSSREDDRLTASVSDKRSTAIVLRELITALNFDSRRSYNGSIAKPNMDFNAKAETEIPMKISKDGNLEASFFSSSMDDGYGSRLPADIIGSQKLNDIIKNISLILQTISISGVVLTGSKLSHAREVMLYTELMSGNLTQHFIEWWKERNKQRGFLFDCLIECLGSKFSRFGYSGFYAWMRLPSMIQAVEEEIEKWDSFSRMRLDEMIEMEMKQSRGKLTDFSFEGFETGADIEWQILQILVDEIVDDIICIKHL